MADAEQGDPSTPDGVGFMSADARFAENLRAARERQGMSQADVAEEMAAAGFTFHQQTVARIESGARSVKLSEAEYLSHIVGRSLLLMTAPPREVEKARILYVRASAVRRATRLVEVALRNLWKEEIKLDAALDRRGRPPYPAESDVVAKAREDGRKARHDAVPDRIVERAKHTFRGRFGQLDTPPVALQQLEQLAEEDTDGEG